MDAWHLLGTRDELLARAPFAVKIEHHRVAVFHHEGRFRAISDICNHRGAPPDAVRGRRGEPARAPGGRVGGLGAGRGRDAPERTGAGRGPGRRYAKAGAGNGRGGGTG
ncbi:MAG TPA: Rieske 2Fe-2S domain-containing protein, partial [Gemmatimonadales bacterium]